MNPGTVSGSASTLFFDDLPVGEQFLTSSRTVCESDVLAFAELTGDHNSLHVDEAAAKNTPYGQRIAHGLLVASIANGQTTELDLLARLQPALRGILNFECEWPAPTFLGDVLVTRYEITEKVLTRSGTKGIATEVRTVLNQNGTPVMISRSQLLVARAPEAAP